MKMLIGALAMAGAFYVAPQAQMRSLIATERAKIDRHAEILATQGRMPRDFGMPELVLGVYGWHDWQRYPADCRRASNSEGWPGYCRFGAYSFHRPAFEQAQRSWWIQGMMRAGSDLLVAVNRNATFDDGVWSGSLTTCWSTGETKRHPDGTLEVVTKCEQQPRKPNGMNSPVGFKVGYMYQGPEDATVIEVVDYRTLRLDKKAPGDVMQYDLAILPPDYVDMCACSMPASEIKR